MFPHSTVTKSNAGPIARGGVAIGLVSPFPSYFPTNSRSLIWIVGIPTVTRCATIAFSDIGF